MSWNQMSDDSWMEEGSDSEAEKQTKVEGEAGKKGDNDKEGVKDQEKNKEGQKGGDKEHKHETEDKNKQRKQVAKKQSRKFPTDQQLLEEYEAGKVEDNKRLKLINVHVQQQREMILTLEKEKKIKKLRPWQGKDNFYTASFWNKDDLIKFIKEKIEKGYKFKIGIYVETQNEKKWKAEKEQERKKLDEEREKEREKQREKEREKERKRQEEKKDHKQHREKEREKQKGENKGKSEFRGRHEEEPKEQKKEFRKQKDEQERRKQKPKTQEPPKQKTETKPEQKYKERQTDQKQRKHNQKQANKPHKQGEQRKPKPHAHQLKNLHRQNDRTNVIAVLSDDGSPADVAQWVKGQGLTKQFSDFTFIAVGGLSEYMDRVCQECYKLLNYGLTSEISQEECQKSPEQKFKYTLTQNKKPKAIKKSLPAIYITKTSEQIFESCQKFNIHIIGNKANLLEPVDEFDQKQYIELFKKNFTRIVQKWEKWIFYAYGKNIAKVLRLSGAIKKLVTRGQVSYEVGVADKMPFVRVQVFDLNRAKCKVDTSAVNSHLQGS